MAQDDVWGQDGEDLQQTSFEGPARNPEYYPSGDPITDPKPISGANTKVFKSRSGAMSHSHEAASIAEATRSPVTRMRTCGTRKVSHSSSRSARKHLAKYALMCPAV